MFDYGKLSKIMREQNLKNIFDEIIKVKGYPPSETKLLRGKIALKHGKRKKKWSSDMVTG